MVRKASLSTPAASDNTFLRPGSPFGLAGGSLALAFCAAASDLAFGDPVGAVHVSFL